MSAYSNRLYDEGKFGERGVQKMFPQKKKEEKIDSEIWELIQEIKAKGALSKTLTVDRIKLPEGIGYKIGTKYAYNQGKSDDKQLNPNQLRKYFQQISQANLKNSFEDKRNELYKVLPQIAYAAGRKVCPKDFYKLMEVCISKEAIVTEQDITTLIDFLTAIVAYSKLGK